MRTVPAMNDRMNPMMLVPLLMFGALTHPAGRYLRARAQERRKWLIPPHFEESQRAGRVIPLLLLLAGRSAWPGDRPAPRRSPGENPREFSRPRRGTERR